MQYRGIGPHLAVRGKSHGCSQVVEGTWGIFSCEDGDGPSRPVFVQRCQDSYLVEGHLGILLEACQGNRDTSRGEAGDPVSFPVATVILEFLSIFK